MVIRRAVKEDMARVAALIHDLAVFENAAEEALLGEADLIMDGFGANPAFECLLAEMDGEISGMAIYYSRYSTWKGKTLYLEDLIVDEAYRRQGIGKALLKQLIKICGEQGYSRLEWQVLDWNAEAITFYESMEAEMDHSWVNCRISFPR